MNNLSLIGQLLDLVTIIENLVFFLNLLLTFF